MRNLVACFVKSNLDALHESLELLMIQAVRGRADAASHARDLRLSRCR
jgi:hypothetical protein